MQRWKEGGASAGKLFLTPLSNTIHHPDKLAHNSQARSSSISGRNWSSRFYPICDLKYLHQRIHKKKIKIVTNSREKVIFQDE